MDRTIAETVIKEFIMEYAALPPSYGEIEMEPMFDEERGHYQLLMQGWDGRRRIHGLMIHVDIRGDKIYVQHDGTRESIANRLIEAGIPASNIVLCFHHPKTRAQTKFAVS